MRWRGITEQDVSACLGSPGFTEPASGGKKNAWLKVAGKFLRVTYRQEAHRTVVITAVLKRKGPRGLT
jgi:hypothetical protein